MGGCCGDLISSLLDWEQTDIDLMYCKMQLSMERQKLKKHTSFRDNQEKDFYMKQMSERYKSVPSHDIDYHAEKNHRFIGISVHDKRIALWASNRFKNAHHPRVWESVKIGYGIETVEEYAELMLHYSTMIETKTSFIIKLEDIVSGCVIPKLEHIVGFQLDEEASLIYHKWLFMQKDRPTI